MPKPKRSLLSTAANTTTPPASLTNTQSLARIVQATGNNLYLCTLPDNNEILVELSSRFRNAIWIKRGGFVLVDWEEAGERKNKIKGAIVNIVREERKWKKMGYWPKEFEKTDAYAAGESEEEEVSLMGKMPPIENDDEGD